MAAKQQRRKERELALYGIFRLDFQNEDETTADIIEGFTDDELIADLKNTSGDYADKVVAIYKDNSEDIDEIIKKYLREDWSLKNIAKIDKAILRLAITEMIKSDDPVPKEIAINEAVELAKKYGQDNSSKYINGILNEVANNEK